MHRRSILGHFTRLAGALVVGGALAAGVAAAPAGATPQLCGSGADGTSGICTLFTPNGTYNAGGTVTYGFDSGTGQTSFAVSLSGAQGSTIQSIWLCVGPSNMQSYLEDPANVCTPNGVLAKSPNQRILPLSNSGDTYVFAIPVGDFWFMHLGTGAATLEAGAPAAPPTTGTVVVNKTDNAASPKALAGAGFSLLDSGKSPTGDTCLTDVSGSCSFSDVAPGTYWVEETTAPSGYTLPATTEQEVDVTAGATATVGFVDAPVVVVPTQGTVTIEKTDTDADPLTGAGFELAGNGFTGSCSITSVTAGHATCTISDVPDGTYTVSETTAPAGYTPGADQSVVVSDGVAAPDPVVFVDTKIATSPGGPGSVTVRKTDGKGAPLTGATFSLDTDDGGAPGTATGSTCTTTAVVDDVALCTMTGVTPGTYWVVETTAPAGYSAGAAQLVTVTAETTASVTFVDDPVPAVSSGNSTSTTTTPEATVTGATTVHTGEAFAGSTRLLAVVLGGGLLVLTLGLDRRLVRRRRSRARHMRA